MVWRAAVDGEARILLWGASAGVRRGGSFFCFLRGSLAAGALAGPAAVRWLLGPSELGL